MTQPLTLTQVNSQLLEEEMWKQDEINWMIDIWILYGWPPRHLWALCYIGMILLSVKVAASVKLVELVSPVEYRPIHTTV